MRNLKSIMAFAVILCMSMTACAKNKETKKDNMGTKVLVAYFSATGTTEGVAEKIASVTGGDLCEIKPAEAYTSADLDWTDHSSRSSKENSNASSRPAIVKTYDNLNAYDTIYLGYPIWWDVAPRVVNTFIESYDLKGKTVIPFATSGGSTISNSVKELKRLYPDVNWQNGRLLNRATESQIKSWIGK